MIIGLRGTARSGKDEAAKALASVGFERVAFADALREFALAVDPYVELYGDIEEEPWYDNTVYYRLSDVIYWVGWDYAKEHFPDVRRLLQRLGTEAGRDILGENIWVDTAFARAQSDKIVVTDMRFPNEFDAVKSRGGYTIQITRPGIKPPNNHVSETALEGYTFDFEIINAGTLEQFHENVLNVYKVIESRQNVKD